MTFPKMNLIEKNTDIFAMFLPTKRIFKKSGDLFKT